MKNSSGAVAPPLPPPAKPLAASCTEGPWQSQHLFDAEGIRTIIGGIDGPDDGRYRYTVVCELGPDLAGNELEANRRLIVAAPDTLKALSGALGYLLNAKIDLETGAPKKTAINTIDGGIKLVRAAIAKAGG